MDSGSQAAKRGGEPRQGQAVEKRTRLSLSLPPRRLCEGRGCKGSSTATCRLCWAGGGEDGGEHQ